MTRIPFGNAGSLEILRFVRDFARKKRRLRRNRLCIVLLGAPASLPAFFPKMIIIAGKDAGAPSIFKLIINCQRNGLKRPFPSSQRSGRCIPAPDAGLRSKTSRTSAFPNRNSCHYLYLFVQDGVLRCRHRYSESQRDSIPLPSGCGTPRPWALFVNPVGILNSNTRF